MVRAPFDSEGPLRTAVVAHRTTGPEDSLPRSS
jgi:hypothetical protein